MESPKPSHAGRLSIFFLGQFLEAMKDCMHQHDVRIQTVNPGRKYKFA